MVPPCGTGGIGLSPVVAVNFEYICLVFIQIVHISEFTKKEGTPFAFL